LTALILAAWPDGKLAHTPPAAGTCVAINLGGV
jgi:hypothetical protein